ncbi:DNA-3-methyladenine glycosylase I [Kineosporia succinea]|uniref:DNA-3-methyladenine glycosylase I n=1 Tax=Kineosporia succinea TaxID=84632 RepID=A0ABT9NYH2_9ACTN|nr:DNA-3-methyladenine glycosylase I [Kineosporia succinea]MDP9825483.1 DNA-3-methyladenine glycosylase I [Kineosporia succinea]
MGEKTTALVTGDDGLKRCSWGTSTPDYRAYHDDEWGRAVHGETRLFERMTLEAFQSGLAWITILRKRENFRAAFAQFDAEKVAAFGEDEVTRLLADAGIVRNRAKINAAIQNARAVLEVRESVEGGLDALIWSFAPSKPPRAPRVMADVAATTPESTAMAKALKRHGFAFVGPTTAYAAMQACGLVNDHFAGCHARPVSGSSAGITPGKKHG